MSLTGELGKKDSPVTRWFGQHVINIRPISEEWNAAVKAAPVIRPRTGERPSGTVGTAFDYRVRYWFRHIAAYSIGLANRAARP